MDHLADAAPPPPDAGFSYSLPALDRDIRYFVTAGDATSPIYDVRLLRVPAVAEFRVQCHPPAYLRVQPFTLTNTDGRFELPAGSQLTVDIVGTEPLRRVLLTSVARQIEADGTSDPAIRRAHFSVAGNETFTVHLTAVSGMATTLPRLAVRQLVDRPPVVRMLEPEDFSQIAPSDQMGVRYIATDVHGVSQLTLEIRRTGNPPQSMTIPIPHESRDAEGVQPVSFRSRPPVVGDVVTLRLQATDTAGQTSATEARHVLICPNPPDPRAALFVHDLSETCTIADRLVKQLDAAASAFDQSSPRRAGDSLSDADQSAPELEQSLFALLRDDDGQSSAELICNLIDACATCRAIVGESTKANADASAVRAWLSRTGPDRHSLTDALRILHDGREAALLRADRAGAAVFQGRALPRAQAAAERVQQLRQKAGDRVTTEIRSAGLDPLAADLDEQLQLRIDTAAALCAAQAPADFSVVAVPANQQEREVLNARLFAAAKAQTLRTDGDLKLGCDLATRSGAPAAKLLAFRASAAAFSHEDAKADALDAERRKSSPRSDLESSISRSMAVARALDVLRMKLEKLDAVGAGLQSQASAVAAAWNVAIREAAIDRLIVDGPPLPAPTESTMHPADLVPSPDTTGYDDQLRVYFQALNRKPSPAAP